MNILEIEQERALLKVKLISGYSSNAKLLFIYDFYKNIFSTQNKNLIESCIPEFLTNYIHYMKLWTVYGMKSQVHELLIEQAEKIKDNGLTTSYQGFTEVIKKLKDELEKLQRILRGEEIESVESKAYFPLLEEDAIKEMGMSIGVLESVTIKIHKGKAEDKFIIVPSEKEIEEKISEQVKLSWLNAVGIAKKYIKRTHRYHEVIISFDKKAGFCKGNSLGTALTLSFIEEIFETYNSPVSIKVGDRIAFTGGMDEQGNITNTSEEIIKQKTELAFFSNINLFVVPKEEEAATNEKMNELKVEFPKRDLKIAGIEDINDLLDRRTIVEIKKQPVIVRSGKFVKKNWIAVSAILILSATISFFILRDIDTNPYSISARGSKIYIINKSGKTIWEKDVGMSDQFIDNPKLINRIAKIVDIDSDGKNEVIICNELNKSLAKTNNNLVTCYNAESEIIWKYTFNDSADFKFDGEANGYGTSLLDTLTMFDEKCLFLISSSLNSYRSAIYRIRIKDAERLKGVVWSSGHVISAFIKDINADNHPEIFALGYDNGYKDVVFFVYQPDTLSLARLTLPKYLIKEFPLADLKAYIRFPKTDYEILHHKQTPLILISFFIDDADLKKYKFTFADVMDYKEAAIGYEISYDFNEVDIVIDSDFVVLRDSLVAKNILQKPFTGTKEYREMLHNNILFWKDGEWVKKEELE